MACGGLTHAGTCSNGLQTLKTYRCVDPGSPSAACFGVNACHEVKHGHIAVGNAVEVLETGELSLIA